MRIPILLMGGCLHISPTPSPTPLPPKGEPDKPAEASMQTLSHRPYIEAVQAVKQEVRSFKSLQAHLEQLDRPTPDQELFRIREFSHGSHAGMLVTYAARLDQEHTHFFKRFQEKSADYKDCNYSFLFAYLFNKAELEKGLAEVLAPQPNVTLISSGYFIRAADVPELLSVDFICRDCAAREKSIDEALEIFFENTCINDPKYGLRERETEVFKRISIEAAKGDSPAQLRKN